MSEKPLFGDSRLKLSRAKKHITELADLSEEHFSKNPPQNEFTRGPDNEDGTPHYSIKQTLKRAPAEFDSILGDAIHNLRSALDLMAVDLVRSVGGNTKGVYFPFCDKPDELDEAIKRRKFHRAGDDAITLLKSYQPYNGGNKLLRAIHDFDVQDKHHSIILTGMVAMAGLNVGMVDGKPVITPTFNENVEMTFPDDSVFPREPVIQTLEDMLKLVTAVVEQFEAMVTARA